MEDSFSVDAVIDNGDTLRHHRYYDHGAAPHVSATRLVASRVELDEPVGPWPEGTDLHTVLDWLWKRVVR